MKITTRQEHLAAHEELERFKTGPKIDPHGPEMDRLVELNQALDASPFVLFLGEVVERWVPVRAETRARRGRLAAAWKAMKGTDAFAHHDTDRHLQRRLELAVREGDRRSARLLREVLRKRRQMARIAPVFGELLRALRLDPDRVLGAMAHALETPLTGRFRRKLRTLVLFDEMQAAELRRRALAPRSQALHDQPLERHRSRKQRRKEAAEATRRQRRSA